MPFIGNQPALSYTSFAVQHFTTSATTSYTLDYSVANENEIRLVINNVVQQPGSSYAYTASGTTLTLSAATSATDTMYAVFLGKAVQTVTPASGSVTNAMLVDDTITGAKLSKPFNYDSGTLYLDDTNNRVGIGTTSPVRDLHIHGADSDTHQLHITNSTTGSTSNNGFSIALGSDETAIINNRENTDLILKANDTNVLRVLPNGGIHGGLGNTNTNNYFRYETDQHNTNNARFHHTASGSNNPYGIAVDFSNKAPDNRTQYAFQFSDSSAIRMKVWADGDLQNHDGTYGTLSDERIKQNITDANSQWNDIKSLQFKNFKKKDDVIEKGEANAPIHLGVIAQDLEQTSPGLVAEYACSEHEASLHSDFTDWENTTVKGVKYSILYMKAVKALQEALIKIEELETRIQTLENN